MFKFEAETRTCNKPFECPAFRFIDCNTLNSLGNLILKTRVVNAGLGQMRAAKGFPKGFCTNELLGAADSGNLSLFTDVLREASCNFLPDLGLTGLSISMWNASECENQDSLPSSPGSSSIRFDRPAGDVVQPQHRSAFLSLEGRHGDKSRKCESASAGSYVPGRWANELPESGEHQYTYLFQVPHKSQSRIAIEFNFRSGIRESRDCMRVEYLVVIYYLAGLRFFEAIDQRTLQAWMSLIEGLSSAQLIILREAVCAPRYNLPEMANRLGIGKRGISSQLYRIHKFIEPRLPEVQCQGGNGSPLVDLIRAFAFLQFAGRPSPIPENSNEFGIGHAALRHSQSASGRGLDAMN